MAVTVADVKTYLPEFAPLSDAEVQLWLDIAELRVSTDCWGNKADIGTIFLTGHMLKKYRQGSSAASGTITSKSVGDVSVGYAAPESFTKSALGTTSYGQSYLELRSEVFPCRVV